MHGRLTVSGISARGLYTGDLAWSPDPLAVVSVEDNPTHSGRATTGTLRGNDAPQWEEVLELNTLTDSDVLHVLIQHSRLIGGPVTICRTAIPLAAVFAQRHQVIKDRMMQELPGIVDEAAFTLPVLSMTLDFAPFRTRGKGKR